MNAEVLHPEEWGLLPPTLEPLLRHVNPEDVEIVAIKDGKNIIACAAVLKLVHIEGVWMHSSQRANLGVGRMLLRGCLKSLKRFTSGWALAATDHPTLICLMDKLGAIPLPVRPDTRAFALEMGERTWPIR